MSLAPITEEQRKCIIKDTNFDEVQMQKKREQIKQWMKKQPHLPNVPEKTLDKLIFAFLLGTKMSTEKAKHKLDMYYTIRHHLPEVYLNRDPLQKEIKDSVEAIHCCTMPELTPDGIRITIFHYKDRKGQRFTATDMRALNKRAMLVGDARFDKDEFCRGEYLVFDTPGLYFAHLAEVPWLQHQKFVTACQEGTPIRIKGIFVINGPAFIETVLNFLKPVLKEKIRNRVHVFHGDHTNLYKFIPQRILPSDYGGEASSLEENSNAWQRLLESMRDFFIEDQVRKTDESKRPNDSFNDKGQMFGINGSFNKLNID